MINSIKSIILFMCIISTSWCDELVKVNDKESKEFQESAFIKLMNNLNGGSIPYPFAKLLDSFGIGVREKGNILFVPKGRSLVKESADYRNPRIIVAPLSLSIDTTPDSPQKIEWNKNKEKIKDKLGFDGGELFIGFAPNHKALEIISFNKEKNKYDFFVVENYEEGKTPKIVHNPSLCLSCHQNEAPIFPKFPWHELAGETSDLPDNDLKKFSKNEMMERIRAANSDREEIEGINLDKGDKTTHFSFSQVAFFDTIVRNSNTNIKDSLVCEALCKKNDLKCIKEIIKLKFEKKSNYSSSPYFKDIERKMKTINFKTSVIPDRDPYTNEGFKDYVTKKDLDEKKSNGGIAELIGITELSLRNEVNKNKLGYDTTFIDIPINGTTLRDKNPAVINPATPRPLNSRLIELQEKIRIAKTLNDKIALAANECLPTSDIEESLENKKFPVELLNKGNIEKALLKWPSTVELEKAILKELENKEDSNFVTECNEFQNNSIMPVYQYSNLEKVVNLFKIDTIKKPEALFGKYCIQCHGGKTPFIPLPLESAEKMIKYSPKFGTTGVLERLEKNIMPPSSAPLQPTKTERLEMIKLLKAYKN